MVSPHSPSRTSHSSVSSDPSVPSAKSVPSAPSAASSPSACCPQPSARAQAEKLHETLLLSQATSNLARRKFISALLALSESKLFLQLGSPSIEHYARTHFGIERAVYINGVLESTTQLKVDDLGKAVATLPAGTTLKVIQNGPGNRIETTLPASLLGTVIQNSLDNQTLRVVNKIDIKVNSVELFSGARMQQSLSDALNRASLAR